MNSQEAILKHYLNLYVQEEIVDFCRGRWVALHLANGEKRLVFRRYLNGKPLTIESIEDFQRLLEKFRHNIRAVYATANLYGLNYRQNFRRPSTEDIAACMPTWDLDSKLDHWQNTMRTAQKILEILESFGVEKSVYIKWSGNGCHIHIHEKAISEETLRRIHPLDVAYSTVEYVNILLSQDYRDMKVRVENRMDAGRVFTCPLSLHRMLDTVCVCLKPDELDNFTPEWIKPAKFRHNQEWRRFISGEADKLAMEAYMFIGGCLKREKRKMKKLDSQIMEWLKRL